MSKPAYVTQGQLHNELEVFTEKIGDMLDQKLDNGFKQQTELLRNEMDSKLLALENRIDTKLDNLETRLKAHTEEVVGTHSAEVLDTIASVVEPLVDDTKRLKKAVFGT